MKTGLKLLICAILFALRCSGSASTNAPDTQPLLVKVTHYNGIDNSIHHVYRYAYDERELLRERLLSYVNAWERSDSRTVFKDVFTYNRMDSVARIDHYAHVDGSWSLTGHDEIEYDDQGRRKKVWLYGHFEPDQRKGYIEYFWKDGRLYDEHHYDGAGTLELRKVYSYDQDDLLARLYLQYPSNTDPYIWFYNYKYGRLVESRYLENWNTLWQHTFEYGAKGRLSRKTIFKPEMEGVYAYEIFEYK